MRIRTARRVSQVFFLALFLWLSFVASFGERFFELRGWPVDWFLDLDPLVALGTILSTGTLYKALAWSLVTIALTLVFGRLFCGFVCPLGTIQQAAGFAVSRGAPLARRTEANRYRGAQAAKYYVLLFVLAAAAAGALGGAASLLAGLLDPIPLFHRTVNLVLLGLVESGGAGARAVATGWFTGGVFLAIVGASLFWPRFYCRFVCPLGALLGVFSRFALLRIGTSGEGCRSCKRCEEACEGACEPSERLRAGECVLCMNCLDDCHHGLVLYRAKPPAGPALPDLSRRGFLVSVASGLAAVPLLRIGGALGPGFAPGLIRPPGSLSEEDFLARCTRCGQCTRICPTNVLQPAGLEGGLEGLYTPVLDNRVGTSGCQLNCVACGQVCPTAAIRPITLDEKTGRGAFREAGPVRIGTAFIDRGRCLPWAMGKPCIVCQENCPVSPKAIFVREAFETIRGGPWKVRHAGALEVALDGAALPEGRLAGGDHFCRIAGVPEAERRRIAANAASSVTVAAARPFERPPEPGSALMIEVRLERPEIDPEACVGCGICEHECPVRGLRAVRVTAENESRSAGRSFLFQSERVAPDGSGTRPVRAR